MIAIKFRAFQADWGAIFIQFRVISLTVSAPRHSTKHPKYLSSNPPAYASGPDCIEGHHDKIFIMSFDCPRCRELREIALTASMRYHAFLADLEAAHIRHDLEALPLVSLHLEKAFESRNAALAELTNHESTHAQRTPAKALRQSA